MGGLKIISLFIVITKCKIVYLVNTLLAFCATVYPDFSPLGNTFDPIVGVPTVNTYGILLTKIFPLGNAFDPIVGVPTVKTCGILFT